MAHEWAGRAAVAGAVCLAGGGATVTTAVATTPGLGLTDYVSEAGVRSAPHASAYRFGIFVLAAALALIAMALLPAARLAAAALAGAAALTATSGSVTCSTGCPLPPFEHATGADLLHGGASIVAVAVCVLAMLPLAGGAGPAALTRPARVALALAGPLSVAVGLAMLVAGHGAATGVLERALLLVIAAWLFALGLRLGWRAPRQRRGDRRERYETRRVP
ncbi:MAG TPA: DUF998 domain-containing protein [Micromonosporaceae bacterium]|jgi:hypothetical protein